nr:hypothetical protein [uncultured Roseateles sp.]
MHTTASTLSFARKLKQAALPVALLLAAAAGTASAESDIKTLPTVTLQGRASLQATCPNAEEALQEALEGPVMRVREEGVMQVRFTLTGQQISDVQTVSGPTYYRSRVRQVVNELQCKGQGQVAQQHQFTISFKHG